MELDKICPNSDKWEGLNQDDKFRKEFISLMIKTWEAGFNPDEIIKEASVNFDEFRKSWQWVFNKRKNYHV